MSVLIIDRDNKPIDRVPNVVVSQVEHHRTMTMVRFLGRLFAYMPDAGRGFYTWALVAMYWPAQRLSVHQYSPPHLRLIMFGRWEFGLVLGSWALGLKLGQPLMWLKRAMPATGS